MMLHRRDIRLACWIALMALYGFSPRSGTGTVVFTMVPQYAGQPLQLGQQLYHSPNGDSFYVDALRFYLSSVQLQGKRANYREKNSYHLIDAEDSSRLTFVLKDVPASTFTSLCFDIGTDSLTNVSGAMGGDLDPSLGMYWAWNTGYINVKIEGRSNACKTLHHRFEFHLGGYRPPFQTLRRLELPLPSLKIRANTTDTVRIPIDLAPFFEKIQLAKTNQVMIPSKQAAQLADVFKGVFMAPQIVSHDKNNRGKP